MVLEDCLSVIVFAMHLCSRWIDIAEPIVY